MYPKQEKFHEKKIPGILGVMILIVGVVVTTFLALKTTNLFQHAAPSENPNDIRITNITDSSFTVTYRTDTSVPGSVSLTSSQDPNPSVILDDRDQLSGTPHAYGVHSLTAKNLSPQTTYSFSIISGTTTFLNNGSPFAVSTAATISAKPTTQPPAAGRILTAQGNKPDEALIYITSPDGQLVSTLIKPSGLYILPLNTLRTKDLSSYATLSPETPLEILVETAQETAHAKVSAGNTNPVAPMTLSEDYDFTQTSTPIASSSAAGGFPLFSLDTALKATPQILSPSTNTQGFVDQQPLFKGTAAPNTEVEITIHSSDVITQKVTTDANGNWSFRPSTALSPGLHTITISAPDVNGTIQKIQRSFTVFAAGSEVAQTATPSATPVVTPTSTPKPTATPTPKPTAVPSVTIAPSPSATPIPTTSIVSITPSKPKPTLPPTGSNTSVIVGITGIATTVLGVLVFLLTRGGTL